MSKNRCLENFSSTIEYWRPSTTEYWKNHVPLFKKALSGLLALRETFVLMLTNFRLSETLGTSIYFLLFYFIYCNILILYAHLLITHSSFHFQHSLPSCIQSMQHVYFHIDINYINICIFIHCIYFPFKFFFFSSRTSEQYSLTHATSCRSHSYYIQLFTLYFTFYLHNYIHHLIIFRFKLHLFF